MRMKGKGRDDIIGIGIAPVVRDGGIVGDYEMPTYGEENIKQRRDGLTSFLEEMGW